MREREKQVDKEKRTERSLERERERERNGNILTERKEDKVDEKKERIESELTSCE